MVTVNSLLLWRGNSSNIEPDAVLLRDAPNDFAITPAGVTGHTAIRTNRAALDTRGSFF
jgi:hypothetical protein